MSKDAHRGTAREWRPDLYRRAFDIAVGLVLLVVTLPVVLVVAIGSAVALRSWPFFSQQRVGRHGELFTFLKIRTLPPSVPAYIDKHSLASHRIPAFCRVLRRLHLDELPQLYLVLIGQMSLVGPRPEMATLHQRMHPVFAAERTAVRPGCTGLWQISEGCTDLIDVAPEYDRYYLRHRTLRFDLWVLARTLLKMVGLAGVVELEQVPGWVHASGHADVQVIDLTRFDLTRDSTVAEPSLAMSAAAGR